MQQELVNQVESAKNQLEGHLLQRLESVRKLQDAQMELGDLIEEATRRKELMLQANQRKFTLIN